jgi:hypothetical protein
VKWQGSGNDSSVTDNLRPYATGELKKMLNLGTLQSLCQVGCVTKRVRISTASTDMADEGSDQDVGINHKRNLLFREFGG